MRHIELILSISSYRQITSHEFVYRKAISSFSRKNMPSICTCRCHQSTASLLPPPGWQLILRPLLPDKIWTHTNHP